MDNRTIIQKSLDYIEDHLQTDITAAELAEMAGFSLFHYYRLFQQATGLPVMQYILRRRLLHGVYAMKQGSSKIDAALAYGFDTYAGFYKAFCREYGMSPSEYLKTYQPSYPYKIDLLQEGKLMISKKIVMNLLAHWGMEDAPVSNVVYEGSNQVSENEFMVGEDYVLKVSGLPGGLKRHVEIAEALDKAGLQASLPVPTKEGEILLKEADV